MRRTKGKRKKRKAAAPAEAIAPQGADKEKLHQCLSSLSFSLFLLRERVGRATASYKPDRDWGAPIRQVVAAMTVRDAGASACLPAHSSPACCVVVLIFSSELFHKQNKTGEEQEEEKSPLDAALMAAAAAAAAFMHNE